MKIWIGQLIKQKKCEVLRRLECFRSNQSICDFADALYPNMQKTISHNKDVTGHDGVFKIKNPNVPKYINKYKPKVLRWNKNSDTMGFPALNIGASKGRTYDRVLIFTTEPMRKYLETKDISQAGDISKLYVAVTRARYSVAFAIEE